MKDFEFKVTFKSTKKGGWRFLSLFLICNLSGYSYAETQLAWLTPQLKIQVPSNGAKNSR